MYLAVDIGGTKTLVAVFDDNGTLKTKRKFATSDKYEDWLVSFKQNYALLGESEFIAGAVAIPGEVDRGKGIGIKYGNLRWQNNPIQKDLEAIAMCSFVVENDAKVAGLYEAKVVGDSFNKVLYIAPGTGVGVAYILNGRNDLSIPDLGGAIMTTEYEGHDQTFDSFASGKAFKNKYGQMIRDITEPLTWQSIVEALASVLVSLLKDHPADIVIIGGGVGANFDNYERLLESELRKQLNKDIPELRPAKNAEDAVIYGCYELARRNSEHPS